MNQFRKSYYNKNWHKFSNAIKFRDNNKCLKCERKEPEVVLQAHHIVYKQGLKPWEYPYSDCITLCKGCHAREHNLVEPQTGWILISIEDLGGLYGVCERKGCGTDIRYEHLTYHPNWGYKIVGSTCVEHLTMEDQFLSAEILKLFKNISKFINTSEWETKFTKKRNNYLVTTHSHHQIRIYGKENYYSFQIALKKKGERWFEFKDFIQAKNKNLSQVKELGYIVLKGITAESEFEKKLLRDMYVRMK